MTQGFPDGYRTRELQRRAGHFIGKGHTYEDTLERCRAWNQYNTPPLPDEKLIHDITSYRKREDEKPRPPVPETITDSFEEPPWPFKYHPVTRSLIMEEEVEKEDGSINLVERILSPYYIALTDVCRREGEAKFAYVFKQWHPHNGYHEFTLTAGELESASWKALLHDNGANITHKGFRYYIEKMAIDLKGKHMDSNQYEQFGWKADDTAFLVGNALIKNDGTTEFAYGDKSLAPRMKAMELPKDGSLEKWSAAANKLYAAGYEAHGFGLLCSFAAPLMRFICGSTDGGAILSLFSEDSGLGKSKILEAISSVWGRYDALSTAGKDTVNAKFQIISRACHLPVYEEELGQRDPVLAADFVKDFTMGRDKNRAQRDGSVAFKNTRYQTIMVSASNRSLYEIVKASGDRGAVARIFELNIEVPASDDFKYFRAVAAQMLDNCGFAGRSFAFSLLQPGVLEWTKKALADMEQYYIIHLETQPEHRFVVWIMATCHVASKLVNASNILNFNTERLMNWAVGQAGLRVQDSAALLPPNTLNNFILDHLFDCLTMQRAFHAKAQNPVVRYPQRNRLVMRMELDERKLFISIEALKLWLHEKHLDYSSLLKKLHNEGIVPNGRRITTLAAGTDYPSVRVPCWEVDMNHVEMGGLFKIVTTAEDASQKAVKL